jgi:hypothetical protein
MRRGVFFCSYQPVNCSGLGTPPEEPGENEYEAIPEHGEYHREYHGEYHGEYNGEDNGEYNGEYHGEYNGEYHGE